MESRIVVLVVFLMTVAGVISITDYKKYYDPSRSTRTNVQTTTNENQSSPEKDAISPEFKLGKEIFITKGQCVTCHGEKAEGNISQLAPKLSGQHDWYLMAQLKKMKSGERVNEKMNSYLKNLTEKDFEEVVKYITTLPEK